jgi:phosphohistidine swiveling domain-containing protein
LGRSAPYAQPDPWGRQPDVFQSFPSGPDDQPPKKRTGLIIGIVVAVVVLVGGGVTALILLTGKGGTSAAPPAGSTPRASGQPAPTGGRSSSTAPTGKSTGGSSGPAATAQAAVAALNARSATQYATLVCTSPKQTQVDDLQKQWTSATELHASVTGEPAVAGTTATVPVSVTHNGQTQSSKIPLKQQSKWCVDES